MPEIIHTVGLEECVRQGKAAIGWDQKYGNPAWRASAGKPYLRKGIGVALAMHGTAIPYLDMGGASIKMNEDGSFNLLIGATDLGTGSDTVLAQMAAEILGVPLDDMMVYSSDTDFTPFDKGAYASSTTYISGGAVSKAAQQVAERIKIRAARMINEQKKGPDVDQAQIILRDRKAMAPDGRYVTMKEIGYNSLHHTDQEQIMAVASYVSPSSPPPFAAQFVEITVDTQTGKITVDKMVMAVDSGVIVNPLTASGQIEGGMVQALGYAVSEEMLYDEQGRPTTCDLEIIIFSEPMKCPKWRRCSWRPLNHPIHSGSKRWRKFRWMGSHRRLGMHWWMPVGRKCTKTLPLRKECGRPFERSGPEQAARETQWLNRST